MANLNELWFVREDTTWEYDIQPYNGNEEAPANIAAIGREGHRLVHSESSATLPQKETNSIVDHQKIALYQLCQQC